MIQSETEKKEHVKETSCIKEVKTSANKSEIIYSTEGPATTKIDAEEQQKMNNAWEMLRNLRIKIDK